MKNIGILGAGLMEHGLAQGFAAAGCQVTVFDPNNRPLSEYTIRNGKG